MSIFTRLNDQWMGPCVTHIESDRRDQSANLYLSFDDGPDPFITEKILRLLEQHKVYASFFVIVQKAVAHSSLILEMKHRDHAVGNHSWDHNYWNYFQGSRGLQEWILRGESALNALLAEKNIGFRSPAGVRTPALHQALQALGIPLILWTHRFYDTQIQWTKKRALAVMDRLQPGDIILLHDRFPQSYATQFLATLSAFIDNAQEKGFCFKPMPAVFPVPDYNIRGQAPAGIRACRGKKFFAPTSPAGK